MGNSLSSTNASVLKLDKDAPILNKYINDFFTRQPNKLSDSGNNELKKKENLNPEQVHKLKQLFKKPMLARACCSLDPHIPIALPYVFPYVAPKKTSEKNKELIKTNYVKLSLVDPKIVKGGTTAVNVLEKICSSGSNGVFKDSKGKSFNMVPNRENKGSKQFTADKTGTFETLCNTFLGTVDYTKQKTKLDGLSLCEQVINTRKIQNPSNSLYHFYGNSINNATDKVYYLDKNGDRKYKDYNIAGSKYLKNDYPDCNCTNSHFVKLAPQGDDGTRLSADQTATVQQLQDAYCRNSPNGSYVRSISDTNVQLCVNIASNIKALATDDAEINLNQSCKASTKVKKRTTVKKVDMDEEDSKKIKHEEKVKKKEIKKEKKEKIAKAVDKVNQLDSVKPKKSIENVPVKTDTPTDSPTKTDTPTDSPTKTDTPTDSPTKTDTPTDSPTKTDTPTDSPKSTSTESETLIELPTIKNNNLIFGGIGIFIFILIILIILMRKK